MAHRKSTRSTTPFKTALQGLCVDDPLYDRPVVWTEYSTTSTAATIRKAPANPFFAGNIIQLASASSGTNPILTAFTFSMLNSSGVSLGSASFTGVSTNMSMTPTITSSFSNHVTTFTAEGVHNIAWLAFIEHQPTDTSKRFPVISTVFAKQVSLSVSVSMSTLFYNPETEQFYQESGLYHTAYFPLMSYVIGDGVDNSISQAPDTDSMFQIFGIDEDGMNKNVLQRIYLSTDTHSYDLTEGCDFFLAGANTSEANNPLQDGLVLSGKKFSFPAYSYTTNKLVMCAYPYADNT